MDRNMATITVNNQKISYQQGTSLAEIAKSQSLNADTALINGKLLDSDFSQYTPAAGDDIVLFAKAEPANCPALHERILSRLPVDVAHKFANAIVGIAGVGGLGSVVAQLLARSGIGKLVIADFDRIEPTNLNRQQYAVNQIAMLKTEAIKENLANINPFVNVDIFSQKLTPINIAEVFSDVHFLAECLDSPDNKQMLVETALLKLPQTVVVSASGIAGLGKSNAIKTKKISSRHIMVGDNESESADALGLTAPRVGIAACHQANAILEMIAKKES